VITIFHQGAKPDTGSDPVFQGNPDGILILIQSGLPKTEEKRQMKNIYIKNCYLLLSKLQEKTSDLKRGHPGSGFGSTAMHAGICKIATPLSSLKPWVKTPF
jgi:hypothetical protein